MTSWHAAAGASTPSGAWTAGSSAGVPSTRTARTRTETATLILGNLPANKTPAIRARARRASVELCFTSASASRANPIEAQSGSLRTFVTGGSDHPSHTVLARQLQACLRWRNASARHPDVLAAQRRERARIRSERRQRWADPNPGRKPHDQPGKRSWSAH